MDLCEICGKEEAIGVCSSCMGPISHAYGRECLEAGREVWSTLVAGLFGLSKDHVADWVRPIIEATCAFYGKTEDELWAEIKTLEEEYDAYCRQSEGER
jgi:hypothetical protein